ncbi:MAG TPA: protein-glutamate O-methyltransferase [Candidatus Paceibacterota bacterium]|nr:protein-glutamate O-methyltransferase [Candidatus Paceibacterota bacterium]
MELKLESPQITREDYEFISRVVYERSRISLGPDKQGLVTSRLAKRLRQLQIGSYHEYCQYLSSPKGAEELRYLIDRISTNHTHFFREMKHFDFLGGKILPAWNASKPKEPLRVWSSACSSGEEPYSIAIYLAEKLAPAANGQWHIDATDISTRVLDIARSGVYDAERLNDVPPEWLRRNFQKGVRDWEGQFRVKEALREQISFHHLNLLEGQYPFPKPFHVIFCRNVMIYFDRETQTDLIARLSERLAPGGYLMVGHSESLSGVKHSLKLIQPAIYIKP